MIPESKPCVVHSINNSLRGQLVPYRSRATCSDGVGANFSACLRPASTASTSVSADAIPSSILRSAFTRLTTSRSYEGLFQLQRPPFREYLSKCRTCSCRCMERRGQYKSTRTLFDILLEFQILAGIQRTGVLRAWYMLPLTHQRSKSGTAYFQHATAV